MRPRGQRDRSRVCGTKLDKPHSSIRPSLGAAHTQCRGASGLRGGAPDAGRDRMTRPAVLVVMDCFVPAYKAGGPIRSIMGMIEALGGEIDFHVVTRDRDCDDSRPFPGIPEG